MSTVHDRDAIRVKALLEDSKTREVRCFAVDPNITSFANIHQLLTRAFQLTGEFEISYQLPQSTETGKRPDVFVSLTSDFDLDAAFLSASLPYLSLKVDPLHTPDEENTSDWSLVDISEAPPANNVLSSRATPAVPFHISIKHQMEKTFQRITNAFTDSSKKGPLTEMEWHMFLDMEGRLVWREEFFSRIFQCGSEPSLRKEVWPHLLHVFPPDLTQDEREKYLLMKSQVYWHLRSDWMARDPMDIESLSHMVLKDVVRTDRSHPYFAVPDDHQHLKSLFNILLTYALTNPDVSYVQGMSDLASPILVVMDDESIAFTCFCALMDRMKSHFLLDSKAVTLKFEHLSLLVQKSDQEYYKYLLDIGADDMFFCYRWLLLDLKREFPFADALQLMEVLWSTASPPGSPGSQSHTYNSAFKTTSCSSSSFFSMSSEETSPDSGVEAEEDEHSDDSLSLLTHRDSLSTPETSLIQLPGPYELGGGNPFVLFMCLAMLLLHKESSMQKQMDYNSLAMYFDKMLRKHDLTKTLCKARDLYMGYLELCEEQGRDDIIEQAQDETPNSIWYNDDPLTQINTPMGQFVEC